MAALYAADSKAEHIPSPSECRKELEAGNLRFIENKALHPHSDPQRRRETAHDGQHPIALVLTCSDSRTAVELLFDQGIGDVFVVRVAGNTAGDATLGSIEYAVEHLRVPLVVVLGHTQCGAVAAVWQGDPLHGPLAALTAPLIPVVQKVKKDCPASSTNGCPELKERAAVENVRATLDAVKADPVVAEQLAAGAIDLAGAVYDISSGRVSWLEKE